MLLRPVSVLLFEGQEDEYLLIGHLLSQVCERKFDLVWIDNFAAAMATVEAGGYDVCLVGYDLGGQNGLDFIREATERGCQIPMILLAEQDEQSGIKDALHTGAADLLVRGRWIRPCWSGPSDTPCRASNWRSNFGKVCGWFQWERWPWASPTKSIIRSPV